MDAFQSSYPPSGGPDCSQGWQQVVCMSRDEQIFPFPQKIWLGLRMLKAGKAVSVFLSREQVGLGGPFLQLASSRAALLFGMLIFKG